MHSKPRTRFFSRADPIRQWSYFASLLTVASLTAIGVYLAGGAFSLLRAEGWNFFVSPNWSYRRELFGAAAMIYGTLAVAAIALVIAAPLGVFTALFMSEVCPRRVRLSMKLLVELLAGVPSVVYGLLGVLYLRNWVQSGFELAGLETLSGDTLLTAGLLLAVMIVPTVATLSDDALQSVPSSMRDAGRGLGLSRTSTVFSIILPHAFSGIIAALLLSLGRALGETIAVFLVVGRADGRAPGKDGFLQSLISAGQTITSKLGGAETNIAIGDAKHTAALLSLGLALLLLVGATTLGGELLRARVWRRG